MKDRDPALGSADQRGRDLDQVIAVEARLAARLEQATVAARALLESARARIEECERHAGKELDEAIARLMQEVERERQRNLQDLSDELGRELRFLDAVSEDRITQLARSGLRSLLRPPEPGQSL